MPAPTIKIFDLDGNLISETVDPGWTLDDAKDEAYQRIADGYAAAINAGVAVGGVKWAITDADRAQLSDGLGVLTAGLVAQLFSPTTPTLAVFGRWPSDYNGAPVVGMTVQQYMQMALDPSIDSLAKAIGALQGKRNALNLQIAAAQTVADADAIVW